METVLWLVLNALWMAPLAVLLFLVAITSVMTFAGHVLAFFWGRHSDPMVEFDRDWERRKYGRAAVAIPWSGRVAAVSTGIMVLWFADWEHAHAHWSNMTSLLIVTAIACTAAHGVGKAAAEAALKRLRRP